LIAIIVPVLWILFDVGATILTAPADMPLWTWRLLVWGGISVAGLTLIAGFWDRRQVRIRDGKQDGDMTELKERLSKQGDQLTESRGILLGMGFTNGQIRDFLIAESKTSQPIQAVQTTVAKLESQLERYQEMFWNRLSDSERTTLVTSLVGLGLGSGNLSAF